MKETLKTPSAIKCPACNGQGSGNLWKDRDPIEGYKLAPYYTCLMCRGEKFIYPTNEAFKACLAFWRVFNRDYNIKARKFKLLQKQQKALKEKALSKLTAEEKKVLGL